MARLGYGGLTHSPAEALAQAGAHALLHICFEWRRVGTAHESSVQADRRCQRLCPPYKLTPYIAQCASAFGRSWNCTTSGLDCVFSVAPGAPGCGASMPSMCTGVRLPEVTQRPRPFQPTFGSSMRPSRPLAKKPIG